MKADREQRSRSLTNGVQRFRSIYMRLIAAMGHIYMEAAILKLLAGTKRNILLAPYTTFRIGGPAKYFFAAKTAKDIQEAIGAARKLGMRFFVLAGGSNVLVSDKGFDGLVIAVQNTKHQIRGTNAYAEAGVSMATLVRETGKKGLSGLEWAGGLPGSAGGAVRGNAGAFGGEVKDAIIQVLALDEKGNTKKLNKKQCRFSYRSSLFKEKNWIVLSATFRLKKGNRKTIQAVAKGRIRYRKERHPLEYPNAGSMFKNCPFSKFPKKLQKQFSSVVKTDPFPVVPTAHLISKAQLKGLRVGRAEVSKKHPNYVVNLGGAKAKDVLLLVEKVKKEIKRKFSVTLEQEVQYVA